MALLPPPSTLPAFKTALCVFAGVIIGRTLPSAALPPLALLVALLLLLLVLRWRSRGTERQVAAVMLCIMLGAGKYVMDRERVPALPRTSAGKEVSLIGTVDDEPRAQGSRVELLVESLAAGDSILVAWHTHLLVDVLPSRTGEPMAPFAYGMTIALRGTLGLPPAERNPGEFSQRRYDEANGITHVMAVRGMEGVRVLDTAGGLWLMRRVILPSRRWILALIDRTTGGEEGEFLKGLLIGERGGLSRDTKEAFVNAGVAHVLAVSGSNVAVVASVLFMGLELLRVPRRARAAFTLAGLFWYMLVTGSQPPVVRATIMAAVLLGGRLFERRTSPWNALGVAALLIAALDARQAFDIGFQLSFGAVLSIMVLYPRANEWIGRIRGSGAPSSGIKALLRMGAVSVAATLGTLPLTALSFGRVSVIGVLANIVVIPATGLSVMIGGAAIGGGVIHPWPAETLGALNRLILHWTLVLTRLAGFSCVAYIDTIRFTALDALPYYVVLLAAAHNSPRLLPRLLVAFACACVFLLFVPRGEPSAADTGRMRITFIDVGQGDAALAELPDGMNILVDAGPRTPTFDAGERTVVPFLRRRGIGAVDLLIVSHVHTDHAGGVPALFAHLDVRRVITASPSSFQRALGGLLPPGVPARCDSAHPGEVLLSTASARVYLLYPFSGVSSGGGGDNESLVVKLQYGAVSFLLTGDAGQEEEDALLGAHGAFLRSKVLKAPHHGSQTSSSGRFLEAVCPEHAVISVGKYNRFGHPSPAVVERYRTAGASVSRTDEEGAVMFETDGSTVHKVEWR